MTTAPIVPRWASSAHRHVDRTAVVLAAGGTWLLLLLIGLALLLV